MNDEIEIFLTSPIAFAGGASASNSTIAALTPGKIQGVRVNGKIEPPTGIIIKWGIESSSTNRRYYYGSTGNTPMTKRKIEGFKKSGQEVQFKITQVENFKTPSYNHYFNNEVGKFNELIQIDKRTIAFLENIPGLEEHFKKFVNDTMHWWVHNEETVAMWATERNNNTPHSFITSTLSPMSNDLCEVTSLITKENMANLENHLGAILEEGTKASIASYKLETYSKLGIKNGPGSTFLYQRRDTNVNNGGGRAVGPYEDASLIPSTDSSLTVKSWKSDLVNEVKNLGTPFYFRSKVDFSDFTVNFRINPGNYYRIYAQFSWKKITYAHNKTVETRQSRHAHRAAPIYTRNTDSRTIYLPYVDSLCLEILPPKEVGITPHYRIEGLTMNYNGAGLRVNADSPFVINQIRRVRDATKKRASKGGYKGGYQGIDELRIGTTPIFAFITKSNFSDIAGTRAIPNYLLNMSELSRSVPLTMEQYMGIERPKVDVKPIEIGHLNFLRLSDPPKRLVVGDTLSDLLLPSMPALIIAVDTDMKVTNGELYQTGHLCSGDCSKNETVDINLPPGLYLVERKLKCALGHDPGRAEYTAGFGDICNEVITVRNMLSQLNLAYDEFRGNMVGTSKSNKFANTRIDSGGFLSRLG